MSVFFVSSHASVRSGTLLSNPILDRNPQTNSFSSRIPRNSRLCSINTQGSCSTRRIISCCTETNQLVEQQESKYLFSLQNGSDIRGVAFSFDASSSSKINLTPTRVAEIAAAFARTVAKEKNKALNSISIAIGRDSRVSGELLLAASASGILSTGACSVNVGLATTPAMFMSTVTDGFEYDGAIMLTASHLPPDRNGMKFFMSSGGASKSFISSILSDAAAAFEARGSVPMEIEMEYSALDGTRAQSADFMSVYASQLVETIRNGTNIDGNDDDGMPLKGFRIVVDAGNGAGGFFASKVLQRLGADTTGSQFLDPDGRFPNHIPNPEDSDAMHSIISAVITHKADLGIIFDTDVDRSAVVDSKGGAINRNKLIALLSAIVLRETPKCTIVTDSVTSKGLKQFITARGGKHFRYKRGYKNVIDKGLELIQKGETVPLAIETSGHGAMQENYMLDDGAYLSVKILIEMVRLFRESGGTDKNGLIQILESLEEPKDEAEFRLKFKGEAVNEFSSAGKKVVQLFTQIGESIDGWSQEEENYEGMRFVVDESQAEGGSEGWILLRQSLHDPLVVLNVESSLENGVNSILRSIIPQLEQSFEDVLDFSSVRKHM